MVNARGANCGKVDRQVQGVLRRRAGLVRRRPARPRRLDVLPARRRPGSSARAVRRGRVVRRARTARRPSARSARRRDVLRDATASGSSSRATASSPPTASAPTAHWARTTSGACWRSRVSLSEDLRHELAAIAPRSECDRLAELSGLFHSAGSVHLKGRGEVSVHLDVVDLGGRAARVQPPAGVRRRLGDPDVPSACLRRGHAVPAPRRRRRPRPAGAARSRRADAPGLTPLERPPKRVVARACCRAAYLRGALLGGGSLSGPRSPHLEIRSAELEAPSSSRASPRRRARARASSTAAGMPSPTRRGSTRSPTSSRSPARGERSSYSKSAPSWRRRSRAPIGSRTPTTQISSARAVPPTSSCGPSSGLRRSGRAPEAAAAAAGDRRARESVTRRCRCASSRSNVGRRPPKRPSTDVCGSYNSWHRSDLSRVVVTSVASLSSYSQSGGSALVRRRIQTPSDATVLSVVQPEGEVVLGASPPARRFAAGRSGGIGRPAKPPPLPAAQALPQRPA